jgi:aspartyl-tRNA(Asn)/glutamyl-tRNA(Gln) amidotransferase subunit C
MPLSHDDVIGLARLARIEVGETDTEAVRGQLNRIFDLVGQLQAVDTKGVEPMSHAGTAEQEATLRLREDKVTEADRRDAFQAVAPRVEQGLYLVPKVIE